MHHSKGEASRCVRGVCVARVQEVPAGALGDARRGGLHRVPRQMSVAGGGLYLSVREKLPDRGQALAEGQCARCNGMAKTVQSDNSRRGKPRGVLTEYRPQCCRRFAPPRHGLSHAPGERSAPSSRYRYARGVCRSPAGSPRAPARGNAGPRSRPGRGSAERVASLVIDRPAHAVADAELGRDVDLPPGVVAQDERHAWSPQRRPRPRRAPWSVVTGEPGPKAPGFFGRGRIELRLVEPSADDEEVHLRRLVPIDDLLHLAREEGTPVRPTAVHVGQAVLLRERPGGEQAPALRADVRVGGQRRHGPPHQAGRLGLREAGVLLDGVAPVRLGDPERVEYSLGAQEPRGDRQRVTRWAWRSAAIAWASRMTAFFARS